MSPRDMITPGQPDVPLPANDARLLSAFEQAPTGVALTGIDGRWLKVNRRICEMTGYAETELEYSTLLGLVHPDDVEACAGNFRDLLSGEAQSLQREQRLLRRGGDIILTLMNVSLARDASGCPLHFVVHIQDAAKWQRTDEETRLRAHMLDNIGKATIATDPEGIITYVNRSAAELYGWTPAGMVGRNVIDATIAGCDRGKGEEMLRQLRLGEKWNGELLLRTREGVEFPAIVHNSPLLDENGRMTGIIGTSANISKRKVTERALRESAERFRSYFELGLIGMTITTPGKSIVEVNDEMCRILGYERAELLTKSWAELTHPDDLANDIAHFERVLAGEYDGYSIDKRFIRKQGDIIDTTISVKCVRRADGSVDFFLALARDITERKRLEEQLSQARKLETVGKLAGGVAHEFNSILTSIIGQSDLLLDKLPFANPLRASASDIRRAADRAAALTRQLLAYGRKQLLQPEALDLNELLARTKGMLDRAMNGRVNVRIVRCPELYRVKADAQQIEQVLMNLATNARDAMQEGGTLTFETSNVIWDEASVDRPAALKPGEYAMLSVTDTGTGMSVEVKARLFEPFFSTKGVGGGTGLGLATCYGVLKQSGGHISVLSEPGKGSTFTVYLPRMQTEIATPREGGAPTNLSGGKETILLVEDDYALREMASMFLERLGYTVLEATNGMSALSVAEQHGKAFIHLLLTDMLMPQMNGNDLAERVLASHPETKILFTTAYTASAAANQGMLYPGAAFLQKPFTPSALAQKVREVLDSPKPPVQGSTV